MRTRRVPVRRSLVVRLLATSILVAVCAAVATAWLAVQSTTRAIQQEQGRSLAEETRVYDTLLGYAATHRDWAGVGELVAQRAGELGRRVTLATEDRQVIADSHPGPAPQGARPAATVDPLRVDVGLTGGAELIDPRAVGPYRPSADERREFQRLAEVRVRCLAGFGIRAEVVTGPDDRPTVRNDASAAGLADSECPPPSIAEVQPSMHAPLRELTALTARCLGVADDGRKLELGPDFSVLAVNETKASSADPAELRRARTCVERARQDQLRAYVAPPALLFVTEPGQDALQPVFNLSPANTVRIAAVTGAVLVLAVLVTVLVGRRLVRPLQALTEAARRPVDHQTRVPVTTNDEIGYLATALNDLAERREHAENQRKAMVSDVAHELRTPLTNIRSWLEAAQDGLATADPQLFDLLLEEALLLQHVIDDLRDLAAADAGSLRLHPEPVYIGDLVTQVAESHRSAAETAGVRLRTEIHGDPRATVDPVRLRQMVANLLSNAIRHTPAAGTVTVGVATDRERLVIAVQDTGVGIAPADLPKVFDRFWRADASRTRATGGSGLGLAITRRLAEAHGGDITVTSRPGAGTTFTIGLPH
jgi:two-component system sensor histidine kinase BaeS